MPNRPKSGKIHPNRGVIFYSAFMIYLSQILGKKVKDSSDAVVGKLRDVLVKPKDGCHAPLVFLLLQNRKNEESFIPFEYVENLGSGEITLTHLFPKVRVPEVKEDNYLFLNRDVLDKQIVDVAGARVVRVNDLQLGLVENQTCVLSIDVSSKGLLRRLGLAWLDFPDLLKVKLIDWRNAQPIKGALKLDIAVKNLTRLHPADIANIIEDLSVHQGSALVNSLDNKSAARVIEEIEPHLQTVLVKHLGPEKAAGILSKMPVDEIVDLMKTLPREDAREFMSYLQSQQMKRVERLLPYKDDTAGGLMVPELIGAQPEWTASQTIAEIRKISPETRSITHIYITNKDNVFQGAISLRTLFLAKPEQTLGELMKQFGPQAILHPELSVEEIMRVMTKYNLYTAAVVDNDHRLLGMVTIDDVLRVLMPHA